MEIASDEFSNMTINNKSIVKLNFTSFIIKDVHAAELSRFVREYPMIEMLDLWRHRFTAGTDIEFMNQLNSLKSFRFFVMNRTECDCLLIQLDEKWQHKFGEIRSNGIPFKICLKV